MMCRSIRVILMMLTAMLDHSSELAMIALGIVGKNVKQTMVY